MINRNLEAFVKQLYDYWLVQFDFPDEHGRPYKSSGGKMVWNEKLKREIPVGWENENMEAFLTIKNGRDHKHLASGNFPVYGSGGEMRRVSEYLYNGESVLMPRKGSLNNIMYVNRSFWTVDTMFYSEMKIPHCAKFVFYTIKDIDFTRWDSGTGVPSMTASTLYSIPMVKPNNVILQRFDNVLSPLFQKLEQAQLENEDLVKQRDALLPLLMNGQVEIKQLNSDFRDNLPHPDMQCRVFIISRAGSCLLQPQMPALSQASVGMTWLLRSERLGTPNLGWVGCAGLADMGEERPPCV